MDKSMFSTFAVQERNKTWIRAIGAVKYRWGQLTFLELTALEQRIQPLSEVVRELIRTLRFVHSCGFSLGAAANKCAISVTDSFSACLSHETLWSFKFRWVMCDTRV